ncbi:hypothetical protein KD146_14110 [Devosia sp. BSSL-BM10]|uniref:Photosynthesis system II assembly factor Ycf48/Hcf136-like domain-containing protein n=1 Tax=Devosia litorisediminis TaxID=2829817 RepID=A0A942I6T1_9HYPH|nr:hypothetical protein [Devosia litorisediminis]MBS3849832.1 hypothetical protein [Devosia litorisediminis]
MNRFTLFLLSSIALLSAPAVRADSHGVPISSLAHAHGIAFATNPAAGVILATHHGVYNVDDAGQAILISQPDDFMGFTRVQGDRFIASGHPVQGGNMGVLLSENAGADWDRIADGSNGPVDFHAMSVSAADRQTVYGLYGGIQVSQDGGESWTQTGPGAPDTIDIAAAPDSRGSVYAGTRSGLMFSDDFGASWALQGPEGVPVTAVEASSTGTVYAFFAGAGLFARNSDGKWSALSESFGNQVMLHIALDEASPDRMASVLDDGSVLLSSDGGVTWRALGS